MGLFAQNVSLDQAVQSSARTIESRLPQGTTIAVLTFTSSSQTFSDYIVDELATAISSSRKLKVIDRQNTDTIRKELNIQMSGDVSDNEVRRVGHQLGAQYVVTGSLVDVGNAYRFRLAAINVETAVREGSSSLNININDPQVVFLLTGQRPTQTKTGNTDSSSDNSGHIYRIGDIGPAGGIVFYDRGVNSIGWRYLEAAPVETEFRAQWGPIENRPLLNFSTSEEIGSGRRNTQLIVEFLNSRGESGFAAQLCASLDFNGYSDWFLPSTGELELVYKNLAQNGLGSFSVSDYWSSYPLGNVASAHGWDFNTGSRFNSSWSRTISVRAIRAF